MNLWPGSYFTGKCFGISLITSRVEVLISQVMHSPLLGYVSKSGVLTKSGELMGTGALNKKQEVGCRISSRAERGGIAR